MKRNKIENKQHISGNRFHSYKERFKNISVGANSISAQTGITLIALVITIILMLILAGVVLYFTVGENGLIARAKLAAQKYENAALEEDNMLAQAEYYMANDRANGINVSKYIKDFIPVIDFSNGTYIEVSVPEIQILEDKQIIGYVFLINGKAKGVNEEGKFIFTQLEFDTEYAFEIIAIDENGDFKRSEIKKQKTASVLYLYHNGNECNPITGGWTTNRYCTKEKSKFYYASLPDSGWNGARTVNGINFDQYKKIGVSYNDENTAGISFIISDYPFSTTSWLHWAYTSSESSFNMNSISNSHVFWFYAPSEGTCLSINSIWLEK